jgi:hypothetical protein
MLFLAGTKPVSARSTRISGGLWIPFTEKNTVNIQIRWIHYREIPDPQLLQCRMI